MCETYESNIDSRDFSLDSDYPLVSVILPTYNDTEYINRAIQSVYKQKYENIQLIIVDSNPDSPLQGIEHSVGWIERLHQEAQGVSAARNIGLKRADGDIISFLDADDEWLPRKLAVQVEHLQDGPDIVYSDEYRTEGSSRYEFTALQPDTSRPLWKKHFLTGLIPIRTVAAWSYCFSEHRFDEQLSMSEDPHLWTRILHDFSAEKIDRPLAIKHIRADSLTEDYKQMYRCQLQSAVDLANRYEELRPLLIERILRTKYTYAINCLEDAECDSSTPQFKYLIKRGFRLHMTAPLFIVSSIPIYQDKVYDYLSYIKRDFF